MVVFFLGVVVAFPLLLGIVNGRDLFYVRYFIVSIAFFLILFSFVLADLYRRGSRGKAACVGLLLAFLIGNGWHIASLIRYGRGQYVEAVRFMAEHSAQSPVRIGGDHDLRVGGVVDFYLPLAGERQDMQYCPWGPKPQNDPEWFICHSESYGAKLLAAPLLELLAENKYELATTFPTAPLSGFYWFLYQMRGTRGEDRPGTVLASLALMSEPDSPAAHYNLGLALASKGSFDKAILHYQRALEIEPDYAAAHHNLGLALASRQRIDEAIFHFQKALDIDPKLRQAHNNLGSALARQGRMDEAIVHFAKALELDPDYAQARATST